MPKTVERLYLPAFQLFPQGANMQSIMPWLGILVLILSGWAVVKKKKLTQNCSSKIFGFLSALHQSQRCFFQSRLHPVEAS